MRAVARKIKIAQIKEGEFVKSTEEYAPSYIETKNGKISRVNIIGKIKKIDVFEGEDNLNAIHVLIEDETDEISCRWFKNDADKINKEVKNGEYVVVIGKVREDEKNRFLIGEIIKPIGENWKKVRELEIKVIGEKYGL